MESKQADYNVPIISADEIIKRYVDCYVCINYDTNNKIVSFQNVVFNDVLRLKLYKYDNNSYIIKGEYRNKSMSMVSTFSFHAFPEVGFLFDHDTKLVIKPKEIVPREATQFSLNAMSDVHRVTLSSATIG